MVETKAMDVELDIGLLEPIELQTEKPIGGKYKLTFVGAVEAEWDGSEPVTVEIPEGGGGSAGQEPIILDGTKDVISWDASASGNAVVHILDRKPLEIIGAQPGQVLTLQCYGNDIDFSGEQFHVAETMNYLFCESYQHWLYNLYYDGKTYDVTGQPVEGGE